MINSKNFGVGVPVTAASITLTNIILILEDIKF